MVFRVVDNHLHALVACSEEMAKEFARRVEISIQLSQSPGVAFIPAWSKPISSQRQLRATFDYILGQDKHHGFDGDPLHDGGNLPDLLGLRVGRGAHTVRAVRELLPRVRRADLLRHLPGAEVLEAAAPLGYEHLPYLAEAAAAAFGLADLRGYSSRAYAARSAAAAIGATIAPATAVAGVLRTSPRTVRRAAKRIIDDRVRAAVEGQLRLRAHMQLRSP